VAVITGAVVSARSLDMRVEVKVQKGMDLWRDFQNDVPTVATVASIGASKGYELFTVNGGTAVATVTGLQVQHYAINELWHDVPFTPIESSSSESIGDFNINLKNSFRGSLFFLATIMIYS